MASRASRIMVAVKSVARRLVQTARLAVGIPDYAAYCAHLRQAHPGQVPMSRDAFFRDRMDARYGRGRSRCC